MIKTAVPQLEWAGCIKLPRGSKSPKRVRAIKTAGNHHFCVELLMGHLLVLNCTRKKLIVNHPWDLQFI
jgi:hypothetical protein